MFRAHALADKLQTSFPSKKQHTDTSLPLSLSRSLSRKKPYPDPFPPLRTEVKKHGSTPERRCGGGGSEEPAKRSARTGIAAPPSLPPKFSVRSWSNAVGVVVDPSRYLLFARAAICLLMHAGCKGLNPAAGVVNGVSILRGRGHAREREREGNGDVDFCRQLEVMAQ